MIIRSDKQEAKKFRRWLTHDVIPTIRKEGFYGVLSKENAMRLCKKAGVTADEYTEYRTGRSLTERVKDAKFEMKEARDWYVYRFSVPEVQIDTGYSHGEILNMARKKKIDKKKDLAAYVQGELRFTYQGRMAIEAELGRKPEPIRAVGETIK